MTCGLVGRLTAEPVTGIDRRVQLGNLIRGDSDGPGRCHSTQRSALLSLPTQLREAVGLRDTGRAMSQENVEFVRGLFAAASDMDKEALLSALP